MSLVVFVVLLGFSASRLNVEQDIMKILPDNGNNAVQKLVFEKLKVKDKGWKYRVCPQMCFGIGKRTE